MLSRRISLIDIVVDLVNPGKDWRCIYVKDIVISDKVTILEDGQEIDRSRHPSSGGRSGS